MSVFKLYMFLLILISFCICDAGNAYAQTVFTYRAPEDVNDKRYEYDNKLLKLALDLTVPKYGPYIFRPSPVMNYTRALYMAKKGAFPNFFMKNSYETKLAAELDYVPIPIDRGIVGYRVCFVSEKNKNKVSQVKTLDDLKKMSVVQGTGWSDVEILEKNKFKVITISNYNSIFPFVAGGRADLFCRGVNEILSEYESYKDIAPGLAVEDTFILYYPLPRFFFTTKGNTAAIERIKEGLDMAWEKGEFVKLWQEQYMASIDFLKLDKRKLFKIPNPLITDLDEGDFKKYYYEPFDKAAEK